MSRYFLRLAFLAQDDLDGSGHMGLVDRLELGLLFHMRVLRFGVCRKTTGNGEGMGLDFEFIVF